MSRWPLQKNALRRIPFKVRSVHSTLHSRLSSARRPSQLDRERRKRRRTRRWELFASTLLAQATITPKTLKAALDGSPTQFSCQRVPANMPEPWACATAVNRWHRACISSHRYRALGKKYMARRRRSLQMGSYFRTFNKEGFVMMEINEGVG